ncbi:MAG: sulfotransferase domain-containing protein [Cognaticolwellia sp.]
MNKTKSGLDISALSDLETDKFGFYLRETIAGSQININHLMVVNSLPKSGSVWFMAMLRHLFDLSDDKNPQLVHVSNINELVSSKPVFGVVVLVRDLRDVVLSWFNETLRNDIRAGFTNPRYPTVEAFYFEHLIGFLNSEDRFENGQLTNWLDFITSRGFPLIRYEDMCDNPELALRKIMTFWKIDISDDDIARTANELTFENMGKVTANMDGFIQNIVATGHLHKGQVGRWKRELPPRVSEDISKRFGEFQARLGYS